MSLSFFNRRPQHRLQDLLMTHADALVSGTLDLGKLLEPYSEPTRSQVEELLALAERINQSLVTVTPSEQFVAQLRLQLGETGILDRLSWRGRIRQLSPRTQLAAGIGGATLTAGVVLIALRPVLDMLGFWRNRRTAAA